MDGFIWTPDRTFISNNKQEDIIFQDYKLMLSIGSRFLRRDCKENKILDNTITVHTPWGPGIVILNLLCTQLAQLHQQGEGGGGQPGSAGYR